MNQFELVLSLSSHLGSYKRLDIILFEVIGVFLMLIHIIQELH